ncbi:hypothetical protein AA098_07665 [Pseudomonas sp. JY-Q]|uniref:hypothetical protein n=1 Tax=unclassified Pseudomonas TaxID=196821 RepID=UPI0006D47EE3|nr:MULTISPECIES: hypothetical protein [unclassified Pseudomonas]ANI33376.1 hypothetical protein AA098_07665 [Pseudomonas sp. JY-Q]EKT4542167.1 hypothetical protein [Pseudomonas putida]
MHELLKDFGIVVNEKGLSGDGLLEENSVVNGILLSRFFIGAYSLIDKGAYAKNLFMGRFSTIEGGCHIGYPAIRAKNFSNHAFAKNLPFAGADEYLRSIKTSRFYLEQSKYTFVGSDVLICKGAIVQEGVVINDGAIVQPNAHVVEDVPPYAIVAGVPAQIVGYRFSAELIRRLTGKKWWKYDIAPAIQSSGEGSVDYFDNEKLIENICDGKFDLLLKRTVHINTAKGQVQENYAKNMIVGPSHIERWYTFSQKGAVERPEGYHVYPIPALSLFSDQLRNLIDWWVEWFDNVVLFVPDFRIGNVAVDMPVKEGRLIKQEAVSHENSEKCYDLGLQALDYYSKYSSVKFWFWCLNGREEFNQLNSNYLNKDGKYRHPIWNYSELLDRYYFSTIDIRAYFESVRHLIVDGSIHPTVACYEKMARIFEGFDWSKTA